MSIHESTSKTTFVRPETLIRALCESKLRAGEVLPPTKAFEGYYIRGIDEGSVNFDPEMLYLLDVGWAQFAGVRVPYHVVNRGDPNFPDWRLASVATVISRSGSDLIFPNVVSKILIGTVANTPEDVIESALKPFVQNLHLLSADTYEGDAPAFREEETIKQILAGAPVVRYAALDKLVRVIDFKPGWRVDQVF
jgi:hypothetical protein